jgi:chemotaxis protein methyltransferase CheR
METQQEAHIQQTQFSPMQEPELEQVREFIYQAAGIYYSEQFFPLLLDRCQQRMSRLSQESLGQYMAFLKSGPAGLDELKQLLDEVTHGDACFYENPPQLAALLSVVLSNVLKHKSGESKVRIWSAGCSTGEEPYSIALMLMEQAGDMLNGRKFEIIATDPNEQSIVKCKQGLYGRYALRNVPEALLGRYFHRVGNDVYQVNDSVKEKIQFQQTDLLDDSKVVFLKDMDVVFCRNVLTYFSLGSKIHVLRHFHRNLQPFGYLFLGYPETLFGITDDFQLVHFTGATGYIKKPGKQ